MPEGALLNECAGGLGIDHRQRIYFAAQNHCKPNDTAIFRFDTRSGSKEFLGTLRGITAEEGNLGPVEHWPREESIAKIHVPFIEHAGKMYFASHDFTDIYQSYGDTIDDLGNHRGAHIYALDLTTDVFADISKENEGGVAIPHQSIVAMDVLEEDNKLACLTFPYGDVLVHDPATGTTEAHEGSPEFREDRTVNVARKIIARNGKVFFSYDKREFRQRELDVATGEFTETRKPNVLRNGFVAGTASTRDRSTVYLVDLTGNLYAFRAEDEYLEDLGPLLPEDDLVQGRSVTTVHGLILSRDESKIYTMPSLIATQSRFARSAMRLLTKISPRLKEVLKVLRLRFRQSLSAQTDGRSNAGTRLYQYEIGTGNRTLVARFPSILEGAWVTGTGVIDDRGRLYFCYHTRMANSARLIQISGL